MVKLPDPDNTWILLNDRLDILLGVVVNGTGGR